jgi:hypothetical protein
VATAQTPPWLNLARQYPATWMIAVPVALALLLIGGARACSPIPQHAAAAPTATVAPAAEPPSKAATGSDMAPAPSVADGAASDIEQARALEAKPSESLSVRELVLLNRGKALQKREQVRQLAEKLKAQPDLLKDSATQAELLHFATDPDTSTEALAALAQTASPIGPDLLFELWTRPSTPRATAEFAHTLLMSRDVRGSASPALNVALELRSAATCEAFQAALPRAQSDGDRRALAPLAKLNSRRGCGEKKNEDCYACLRSQTKELMATAKALKARSAPAYSAP